MYGLWAQPVALVAISLAWRPYEALNNRAQVAASRILHELEPLRPALAGLGPDESLAGPGATNLALLFTPAGQLYQYDQTWVSSPVPTPETGLRFALDAWLMGMDMPRFLEAAAEREPVSKHGMGKEWTEDFRSVLDGEAEELLRRYRVGALLLPSDAPAPERGGPWRREATAPKWTLWRAEPGVGGTRRSPLSRTCRCLVPSAFRFLITAFRQGKRAKSRRRRDPEAIHLRPRQRARPGRAGSPAPRPGARVYQSVRAARCDADRPLADACPG